MIRVRDAFRRSQVEECERSEVAAVEKAGNRRFQVARDDFTLELTFLGLGSTRQLSPGPRSRAPIRRRCRR